MPPKRTSTSETPAITLDAIRQLIADFTAALEAQTAAMASASNPNRNTRPREIPETDIQEKDKKKAKNDKTKHGMEKTKSNRSQSQKVNRKVNPDKVKSQPSEENTT
ncbi:hypothetical protein Tco_0694011 [Tanacetum coccineum]